MRILLSCFFVLCATHIFASFQGEPIIKNFSSSDYKGGSRIYSTVCTSNGLLYASDKSGVLEFDGESWRKIDCGFLVTSLCIDNNDVVYVAGNKGIGKLEPDSNNELRFVSLQNYFSEIHSESLRHSKVFNINGEIVFVLGNEILVITPERLRVIESPHNFIYYQKLNDELYLYSSEDGIYKFSNSKLDLKLNAPEIKNLDAKGFFSAHGHEFMVTQNNGVIRFNGEGIVKVSSEIEEFLTRSRCQGISQLNDSTFVLTTYYNGFVTFNQTGQIVNKYNYNNGLINNTVFGVTNDSWGNLWVGTASGISAIRMQFPLTIYNTREGIGTGYAAVVFDNSILLATSRGLYQRNRDASKNVAYERLFSGHIFGLHKIHNTIYFGHATGIYALVNNKPVQLTQIPGGWHLKQVSWNEKYFLSTTVKGIMLFELAKNKVLVPVGLVKNTQWANEHIEFGKDSTVWAESKYGATRFSLSEDLSDAGEVVHFDRIEAGNRIKNISKIDDTIYFLSDSGVYRFNAEHETFSNSVFNVYLTKLHGSPTNLFVDNNNKVWLFTNKKLLQFKYVDGAYAKISAGMLEYANDLFPTGYESISDLDSDLILIGQEQGFLCFNQNNRQTGPYSMAILRKVQITLNNGEVKNVLGNVEMVDNSSEFQLTEDIRYIDNSIKFYYASGCSNYSEIRYQTFLVGFDEKWTDWNSENIREFTNLPSGTYKFVVRSINQTDEYSYIAHCNFTINPPWYFSKIAFLVYILLFVGLVFGTERLVRFRVKLIQKRNQKKLEDIQFRKEQEHIHNELITEKELIRLKNEKLKTDILYKSKELADSTMNLIEKNRFLTDIKSELEEIKELSKKNKLVTPDIVKVIRKINRGIDNEENWKVFEDYFDNVHANFFKKMKKKYPILTAKDLRLCAYLRMNLSTKEIAPLLNISVRGVEISRYRLRKKINIAKDENLIDFLLKI